MNATRRGRRDDSAPCDCFGGDVDEHDASLEETLSSFDKTCIEDDFLTLAFEAVVGFGDEGSDWAWSFSTRLSLSSLEGKLEDEGLRMDTNGGFCGCCSTGVSLDSPTSVPKAEHKFKLRH